MSKNYCWKNYYLSFSYFATSFRSILASEIPAKYVNKGKYLLYIIKLTCSKVPCTLISYRYFQILPWSYYQIFLLCFFCAIIRENYSLLTSRQHFCLLSWPLSQNSISVAVLKNAFCHCAQYSNYKLQNSCYRALLKP